MAAYEVRESAFTDFGMSVRTNFEVKWGGDIEWMRVSAVAAGSSAARQGLVPGDRIMAIDGEPVTKLGRDSMIEKLFLRETGDRVEILVLGPAKALPRFVILTANRPPPKH
jgi:C-terminal processing protease CtpA/Prc